MITYLQEKFIFLSEELSQDHQFNFKTRFKELFLKADDGAVLHGIHFIQEDSKGIILYFHGNKASVEHWGHWGEQMASDYQHDVVVMDYRGYGKSKGVRSFEKMLADSSLFYTYCQQFFTEDKIILFGRSLGGAFASHTALDTKPKKIILESTFTDILAIAQTQFWWLPVRILLKYPFQNINNIQLITHETHIIHGTNDSLVKYEHGRELYKLSKSTEKEMYSVEGAGHNDLTDYKDYFQALDDILK